MTVVYVDVNNLPFQSCTTKAASGESKRDENDGCQQDHSDHTITEDVIVAHVLKESEPVIDLSGDDL